MRQFIVIVFLSAGITTMAQFSTGAGQNCFCDNHGSGISWYVGPATAVGLTYYQPAYLGDANNQYALGFRVGANISEKFSFQSGAMYARIDGVGTNIIDGATPNEYVPKTYIRTTLLIPVHLVYRFSTRTRVVPYISGGVTNEFLIRDHPSDLVKENYMYDNRGGYLSAYLEVNPGVAVAVSGKASFYMETYYRHSIPDLFSGSERTNNYIKQLGLGLGLVFHL